MLNTLAPPGAGITNGRRASSVCPEEPHHDERPHRNQEARRRACYAVNQIAGRCAEHRAEHEDLLHDVHDHSTEQGAFQWGVRVSSCGLARAESLQCAVTDYRGAVMGSPSLGTART